MMLFCFQAHAQSNSNDCVEIETTCTSGSLRLNGGNTRVLLPNQIALDGSFTLEYWIKNNGTDGVFDRITTTSPTYTFETAKNSGGQLSIYGMGRGWINTGVAISSTEYDHIAWVFDGSTIRLYQNGTEAWSDSGFSADTRLADWAIGNFVDVANVSMDEVRLWNAARTAQQITDNASPCGAIDTNGLIFRFSFDEGSNNTTTEAVSGAAINIEGGANWENNVQTEITTDIIPPTVITQNLPVSLGADGTVRVSAAQLDGGSDDNGGAENLTFTVEGASEITFDCDDLETTCTSGSLRLNGGNTRVLLPNQIALDGSFTLEYWIKNNGTDGVFDRITTTSPTYTFETAKNSGGQLSIYGMGRGWINTGVAISSTEYDHIAWVFDGSTIRLYQNGTEAWSDSGFSADTRLADWAIGNFVDVANVSMDEVRLWNAARTAQQITDNASPCGAIDTNGLVFRFSFDEGSGNTATEAVSGTAINIEGGANWQNDNVQTTIGVPVTLTATDACGNSATGRAVVTVQDNLAPTINLNGDAVVNLNQNQTYTETATVVDNCSTGSLEISGSVNTAVLGSYVLTYSASDDSGNTATATRTVNVIDATPPSVVTQDITVQLDANGNASITPEDIDNGSSDNLGGNLILSLDQTTFDCSNLGVNDYTSLAYQTSTSQGIQSHQGALGMEFDLSSPITINTLGAYDHNSDGIAGTIQVGIFDRNTQTVVAGLETSISGSNDPLIDNHRVRSITPVVLQPGNYMMVAKGFNAVDLNGNLGIVSAVKSTDDANGTIQFLMNNYYSVNYDVNSFDYPTIADGGPVNKYSAGTFGYTIPGSQRVTLTVTDESGNSATGTAIVTIEDNIAPSIAQVDAIQLEIGDTFTPAEIIATDNCGTIQAQVNSNNVNTAVAGSYQVQYQATDASGNQSNVMKQTVNVISSDNIPPTVNVNANVTVFLDQNGQATLSIDDVDNGSFDNDSGIASRILDRENFSCSDIQLGGGGPTTQLVYQTTSTTGNQDFGGSLGMEFDVFSPIVVNSLGAFDHNSDGIANAIRVYIIDKNTGLPVPGLNVLISGTTDPLINNHRVRTVNPVTLPIGSYMIVAKGFNAVDLNGNSQNRSLYQTDDNNGAIQLVGISPFGYNFDLNVFDVPNVQQGTISNLFLAGTFGYEVSNSGTIQVMLTVTDNAGNSASETANVTVADNIAPSIAQVDAIEVDFGTVFIPAVVTATDNCGSITAEVISNNVNTSSVGTYQVQYRATDASGNESSVMAQTVTVIDVVAPVFTSATAVNFTENNTGTVYTIAATDDNAITYSLGSGNDEADFDLNGADLTFKASPDFETKSSYTVNVVATDALGNTANQDVTVTILDVDDEAPVFTSSTAVSVDENTSGTVYTVVATDDNAITYSLGSGNDESDFNLVGAVLSFNTSPDFETKAGYLVNIVATDALGYSSNQDVTITILDVDEIPPVITSATTANFTENTTGIVYSITATDDNAVSYSLGSGNDEAAFDLNGADLSFKLPPDFETQASYTVKVVATDALGNSSNQNVTISIIDVDEVPPVFVSGTTADFTENTTGIVYLIEATDEHQISFSLGSGNDEKAFSLNGRFLVFRGSPDYETKSSYTVNIVATDALGNSSNQDVVISIIDIDDEPPVFTSGTTASFTENTTGTVYTVTATDKNDITYSLGTGNDEGDFELHGANLTFKSSPDYEAKASYIVNLVATDALGYVANQDITISILDVDDEAPVFTSGTNASFTENTTGIVYTIAATDENDITYSLGSDHDENAFNLNGAVMTFKTSPDYETKASYTANVVATDALGNSANQNVIIAILDVDDTPPTIILTHSYSDPGDIMRGSSSSALQVILATPSEPLDRDLLVSDFNFTNGSIRNLDKLPNGSYTGVFNSFFDGTATIQVKANVFKDLAGNSNIASDRMEIVFDARQSWPNNIILDGDDISVREKTIKFKRLGSLQAIDPADPHDHYQYYLVGGDGANDNDRFEIYNGHLYKRQGAMFHRAVQTSASIRVRAVDQTNRSVDKIFTIPITEKTSASTYFHMTIDDAYFNQEYHHNWDANRQLARRLEHFNSINPDVVSNFVEYGGYLLPYQAFADQDIYRRVKIKNMMDYEGDIDGFYFDVQGNDASVSIVDIVDGYGNKLEEMPETIPANGELVITFLYDANTRYDNFRKGHITLLSGRSSFNLKVFFKPTRPTTPPFAWVVPRRMYFGGINFKDGKSFDLYGRDWENDEFEFIIVEQPQTGEISVASSPRTYSSGYAGYLAHFTTTTKPLTYTNDSFKYQLREKKSGLLSEVYTYDFNYFTYDTRHAIPPWRQRIVDGDFSISIQDHVPNPGYGVRVSAYDFITGRWVEVSGRVIPLSEFTQGDSYLGITMAPNKPISGYVRNQELLTRIEVWGGTNYARLHRWLHYGSNGNRMSIQTEEVGELVVEGSRNTYLENEEGELELLAFDARSIDLSNASIEITKQPNHGTISALELVESENGFARWSVKYNSDSQVGVKDSIQFTLTHPYSEGVFTAYASLEMVDAEDNPTLEPIQDVESQEGEIVFVDFVASDLDSDLGFTVVVSDDNVDAEVIENQIKLTPAANFSGIVLVELTASEADTENGAMVSELFNLEILPVNDSPVVAPIANQVVDEDGSLDIAVSATDVEQEDGFLSLNFSTDADDKIDIQFSENGILLKPIDDFYGDITISVTADDHTGTATAISVPETFVLTVNPVNDPPVITNEVPFQSLVEGFADYTLDLSNFFSDIDTEQENLIYSIEDIFNVSTSIDGHIMTISSVPDVYGTFAGTLSVSDGEFTESQIAVFTVTPKSDDIVVVNPLDDLNLLEDFGEARIDISNVFANTADPNAEFFFTVAGNQNISVVLDGTELVLTTEEHYFGTEYIVVTATVGGVANSEDFVVNVVPVNDAPELLAGINDQSTLEDEVFDFVYPASSFTDVDEDALTYSVSFNAPWLIFDATSRTFAGIPMNGDVGEVTVTIAATDPSGASASDEFIISVINRNDEPTDISLSSSEILENNAIGAAIGSFSTTDPDVSNVNFTYDLVSGAGDMDNANFIIENDRLVASSTFDFETKSSYSIRVRTRDGFEGSLEKVFTISILDEDERPPMFDSAPVTEVDETAQYRYPIQVTSPGGLDFTIALAEESDWLSIVEEDGYSGVLVGDPSGKLGSTEVQIIATDKYGATTSQSFSILVKDVTAPTVIGRNLSFELKPDDEVNLEVDDLLVSATDNAMVVATAISKSRFTVDDRGINSVVITATDDSGNEGTAMVTVEIIDISVDDDGDGIPEFMDKYPGDATNGGKPAIVSYVWDDLDGDGRQDADEPAVTDVKVKLLSMYGSVLQEGRTNAYNGLVAFFDLEENRPVKLVFERPSDGYAFTHRNRGRDSQNSDVDRKNGQTSAIKPKSDKTIQDYDAGMWSPGQVEAYVWDDLDGDGRQDEGEPSIENVLVKLRRSNGNVISQARTNSDGIATLPDAPVDQPIKLSFDKPNSSYAFTHRNRGNRALNSDADRNNGQTSTFKLNRGNQTYTLADAGMWSPGFVEAFVWDDRDGDGRQDVDEPGIRNVLVKLRRSNGNVIGQARTNVEGVAVLPNAPADQSIKLSFDKPNSSYAFTYANRGNRAMNSDANRNNGQTSTFKLNKGNQTYTTADAGMWSPGRVQAFVWDDLDGDGRQDANEPGVEDVLVKLRRSNGNVIGQARTGADGLVTLENAPSDQSIKLSFDKPNSSYAFTYANRGNRARNSDANRNSGQTRTFKLNRGYQTYTLADAGLWSPGTVETYVWNDADRDGRQDNNEQGLNNVLVKLRSRNGNVISQARTDQDGIVRLMNAPADQNIHITVDRAGSTWRFSPRNRGNSAQNSDVDGNGKSNSFKLNRGAQFYTLVDAGQYLQSQVNSVDATENTGSGNTILESEGKFEVNLKVYPNPTTDMTILKISSNVSGPARVALLSTSGMEMDELFNGELEANTEIEVGYDASPLPSGVYIVRLVTAGEVRNLKLMVKK